MNLSIQSRLIPIIANKDLSLVLDFFHTTDKPLMTFQCMSPLTNCTLVHWNALANGEPIHFEPYDPATEFPIIIHSNGTTVSFCIGLSQKNFSTIEIQFDDCKDDLERLFHQLCKSQYPEQDVDNSDG